MRRSFKFLLRPTSRQAAAFVQCLEEHRVLYNAALEHRRIAYARAGVSVRYGDQSGELKAIRADDAGGQGRWSFSSQQATLRRLDRAFGAFFRRVRRGGAPGFPRFKGRGWFDTVTWPRDGDGCRWEGAHKAALRLVRDYDLIVTEDLQVANMTRRAAPRPDGEGGHLPNGAAAKSGLNSSILDAGWRVFLRVLTHKAEKAGREVIAVNPANTSRTCARCGHCAKENRVRQAEFRCTACGHQAHADVNAAINILRAGLALRDAARAA